MGVAGPVSLQSEPRVLRIFISHASQDLQIAPAIASAFRVALGDVFAEINIDKWFLQAGNEFKKPIELKLDKTDIFVIVYTGAEKQSHSFENLAEAQDHSAIFGKCAGHRCGIARHRIEHAARKRWSWISRSSNRGCRWTKKTRWACC